MLTINLVVELNTISKIRCGLEPALRRGESKTLQQSKVRDGGRTIGSRGQKKSPTDASAWISWSFASPVFQGTAEAEDQRNKKDTRRRQAVLDSQISLFSHQT